MEFAPSTYDFPSRRRLGYVYVDKTEFVYRMVREDKFYFLSRPRRFGKSLLMSTLASYFEGRKELFDGTALWELAERWDKYPVLRLDFTTVEDNKDGDIERRLDKALRALEEPYGLAPQDLTDYSARFEAVIKSAYERDSMGRGVVVLVDEYDKPMTALLHTKGDAFAQARDTLKSVYSVVKKCDAYIRFAMFTGVTRFSKVGIFSGLNNLRDISMDPHYATVCGFTWGEIERNYGEAVRGLAKGNGYTEGECHLELERRYDGYQFAYGSEKVYNPFSVLNCLASGMFENYWNTSGAPTFLVDALRRGKYDLSLKLTAAVKVDSLAGMDSYERDPVPLLYQTGYLTLGEYDRRLNMVKLRYPNNEVREGLLMMLSGRYLDSRGRGDDKTAVPFSAELLHAAEAGEAYKMMTLYKRLMDAHPYVLKRKRVFEVDFQNCLYIVTLTVGLNVFAEVATRKGRTDIVIRTDRYGYVLELKLSGSKNGTAEGALAQARERDYRSMFAMEDLEVFVVGAVYSLESRTIDGWLVQGPDGGVVSGPREGDDEEE